MVQSRLISLIRKEFIQILRDPRTLALALLIPVMQLFILGYAATNDVRNIPLAVFDQDRGQAARALLDAYRSSDYFLLTFDVNSESEIHNLIDSGKARAGLIIPPNYSTEIRSGGQSEVMFIFDGTDATATKTALAAAQQIGSAHATEVQNQRMAQGGVTASERLPLEVRTLVWYNPDLEDAYFMVPGLIGTILYMITAMLTASAIVRRFNGRRCCTPCARKPSCWRTSSVATLRIVRAR